jgi:tetratricopeptide (TPR) repeat protein
VLGVSRSQVDVAGWEIPGRYFSYQRSGDASGLVGVFYHNLVDILSLATLTVHIDRVMNDPFCGLVDDPVDFLSLAKTYDRGGDLELAALCCEEALHRRLPPALQRECLMRLARLQKRQRSWDAAMRTWDLLLDEGGAVAVFALVEMAKYYEHVERDYPQAMEAVEQALVLSELHQAAWPAEERIDLTRRLARLAQRMGRGRGWIRRRG